MKGLFHSLETKENQDQETKEKQEVYIGIIRLLDFFK